MQKQNKVFAGKSKLVLYTFCALLLLLGVGVDYLFQKAYDHNISRTYSIENLDLLHGGTRIVYDNRNIRPTAYSLSFDGMATDDYYDNYFQLADSNSIQLELQHPGKLFLKVGDEKMYMVADNVQMGRWYKYDLRGEPGKYIRFYIDGKLVFESFADEVVNKKLDYGRIIFGSGYADQRGLKGGIKNLRFNMTGAQESNFKYPLLVLLGSMIGGLIVLLGVLFYQMPEHYEPSPQKSSVYHHLLMSVVFFSTVLVGLVLMKKGFPFAKWSLLLSTGVLLVASSFIPEFRNARNSKLLNAILSVLVMIIFVVILAFMANNPRTIPSNKLANYSLVLVVPFVYGIARLRSQSKIGVLHEVANAAALEFALFILIAVCTCISFTDLQNWSLIVEAVREAPGRTAMLVITGAYVSNLITERVLTVDKASDKVSTASFVIVSVAACMLYVALSLRTDMLFTGSSMMHWEYYVGVIRSIRSGGWLLYDTPSQYGFLPLLVAAALPARSSWDAFYWMQSLTMLVAAVLLYSGAIRFTRMPAPFAALLSMFLVYFSYPGLIGPAPYPSSGPMRFIWCYVLLYCAGLSFTREQPTVKKYVKLALPFWIMGVLWSGESAVYSSSIYLAPVGGELIKLISASKAEVVNRESRYRETLMLIGVPFVILVSVMLTISGIYMLFLGVWPDWIMHFAYGFAYAKGFGEVDMPLNGPIWSLLLLMMVGFISVIMSISRKGDADGKGMLALAATACIWSVSSYYLGRAVPNNIVALFPVLIFSLLLIMKSWPNDQNKSIPAAVGGVFLFLSFVSPLSNADLGKKIVNMNFVQATVAPNLRKADHELLGLMKTAGISETSRVVYYGGDAALPGICEGNVCRVYERTWLPNPLQLMEAPVPESRQKEVINRWAGRRSYAGFIVQKRGEAEDRFAGWLRVLSGAYVQRAAWESANYRILLFSKK